MTQTETIPATTSLGTLMTDFAIYNAWANETLTNWLKQKPESALTQEVASSFSSIFETIVHIWDTERFWYSVLKQIPAPTSFRMNGYQGTLDEAIEGIVSKSREFAEYVQTLSEEEWNEKVFFDTPWVKGTQTRFEFLLHAINHSTYHRGQVLTIGRHAGLTDGPMTDYSFYLLMVKQA
jgi:uncharacterized damage-inducible protein DinB